MGMRRPAEEMAAWQWGCAGQTKILQHGKEMHRLDEQRDGGAAIGCAGQTKILQRGKEMRRPAEQRDGSAAIGCAGQTRGWACSVMEHHIRQEEFEKGWLRAGIVSLDLSKSKEQDEPRDWAELGPHEVRVCLTSRSPEEREEFNRHPARLQSPKVPRGS